MKVPPLAEKVQRLYRICELGRRIVSVSLFLVIDLPSRIKRGQRDRSGIRKQGRRLHGAYSFSIVSGISGR